ncbi:hypothetical protein [Deinococcus sp.]|uniref:hypothetical protein n=1 Tax=Deinococcus sp. TaxID=47478 RepID=UPI003B5C9C6F
MPPPSVFWTLQLEKPSSPAITLNGGNNGKQATHYVRLISEGREYTGTLTRN